MNNSCYIDFPPLLNPTPPQPAPTKFLPDFLHLPSHPSPLSLPSSLHLPSFLPPHTQTPLHPYSIPPRLCQPHLNTPATTPSAPLVPPHRHTPTPNYLHLSPILCHPLSSRTAPAQSTHPMHPICTYPSDLIITSYHPHDLLRPTPSLPASTPPHGTPPSFDLAHPVPTPSHPPHLTSTAPHVSSQIHPSPSPRHFTDYEDLGASQGPSVEVEAYLREPNVLPSEGSGEVTPAEAAASSESISAAEFAHVRNELHQPGLPVPDSDDWSTDDDDNPQSDDLAHLASDEQPTNPAGSYVWPFTLL